MIKFSRYSIFLMRPFFCLGLVLGLLFFACKSAPQPEPAEPPQAPAPASVPPPVVEEIAVEEPDPEIQPPVFKITSIAILKAELINTRFRVGLRIENPNPFPVELSAFSYALYGNGLLWADGTEKNVLSVAAESSLEGNLFLLMNFINMKRDLLDQIIALEDVYYRFKGEARVGTSADGFPMIKSSFDLSGYSQVLEK